MASGAQGRELAGPERGLRRRVPGERGGERGNPSAFPSQRRAASGAAGLHLARRAPPRCGHEVRVCAEVKATSLTGDRGAPPPSTHHL